MFSKKDFISAIITGLITAGFFIPIFKFIGVDVVIKDAVGLDVIYLIIIIPILWVIGVWFGYFLGRYIGFFRKFGKFAAIGFSSTAVDFGVLNLLIFLTSISDGPYFSVFKGISFLVAVINAFLWNKYWTFEAGGSGQSRSEFLRFIFVTFIGVIINVTVASIIVNFVDPSLGLTGEQWANVAAVVATAVSMIWNFIGYQLIVFRESNKISI